MAKDDYCDLLIVDHESTAFVVEAPAFEADPGDLVHFQDPFGFLQLGKVIDKMGASTEGDTYRCMAAVKTICQGLAVYKASWVAEGRLGGVDDGKV